MDASTFPSVLYSIIPSVASLLMEQLKHFVCEVKTGMGEKVEDNEQ
jgi:hypothetical protein